MNNRLTSFIIRRFLPFLRYEYLRELEAYLRKEVTGFPTVIPPEPFSDRQQLEAYRRALGQTIISGICYRMYGLKKETDRIYRIFHLLQTCSSGEATADLREYAESLGVSVNRDFSNGIELAVLHFLDGNISLLRQIEELHSIKKRKSYRILPPMKDALPFPMITEKEREKEKEGCRQYLSRILSQKGMTDVCVISCDRISSDYWFTIKRGHYQETVDEVDTSAKEIVSSIRTPGNTDIVIYRGSSKCLYINLQVSARIQWMMRAYVVIAGRMLFGSDIWELRNRYTLSVFNKKSIADIEVFNNIPGLRRVAVYKLVMSRPLHARKRTEKEVLMRGFTGTYKSLSELGDEDGPLIVVPSGFHVDKAFFYFEFEEGDPKTVSLTPDSNGLELESEQYRLIDMYFEQAGFDQLYNRIHGA